MNKIKIGIFGYGNLGKGVEAALKYNPDVELVAIFTRRDLELVARDVKSDQVPIVSSNDVLDWKKRIDVLLLCGSSSDDLPEQTTLLIGQFNTVDSFDTHKDIPERDKIVNELATANGKISVTSTGWDPGIFSFMRIYCDAILPGGTSYSFYGPGISQGHSAAIRGIPGVKDARQYTMPRKKVLRSVLKGEYPDGSSTNIMYRVCYVVAEDGANKRKIAKAIRGIDGYFVGYKTIIHFVSQEELLSNHAGLPHRGHFIHMGKTAGGYNQNIQLLVNEESNPEFTGSIIVAYARAAYRLYQKGESGARAVFDIPFGLLSMKSRDELLKML